MLSVRLSVSVGVGVGVGVRARARGFFGTVVDRVLGPSEVSIKQLFIARLAHARE